MTVDPSDPSTAAPAGRVLLVVDVQTDVTAGCHHERSIVDRIDDLTRRARAASVPVVWVQHEDDDLVPDAPGWQLTAPLAPVEGEPRVRKRYRDAFVETSLSEVLQGLEARELIVTGSQSDFCVRTAAQRALVEGYDVTIVADAHTTCDSDFAGVPVSGAQIIAHTNAYFAHLRYPGRRCRVVGSDAVGF